MNICPKIHSVYCFLVALIFPLGFVIAQEGFTFPGNKKRDRISFEMVNNLVIIPAVVNGTKLSFLLDTGVNGTLLFGVADEDSVTVKNAKPIRIKGLGGGEATDALISTNNILKIGAATDPNHTLYVILDKKLNFSTRMGIPIHGIVGYDFFRDFIVKTDYTSKRITFYDPEYYKKRCRSCTTIPLVMDKNKPYMELQVSSMEGMKKVMLLIDSGSSDALWLFDENEFLNTEQKNYFESFLGLGLSGDIYGKRSKLEKVQIDEYYLEQVTTSYPETLALENITIFENRDGSLGGELLKRFTMIMDYGSGTMQLKKNRYFNDPFHYDMSGLTLEHDGMIPVKDVVKFSSNSMNILGDNSKTQESSTLFINPIFTFFLAPKYVVAEIREDSPAALAGIMKGDEVVSINGKPAFRYKLYELVNLFASKPGKKITIEINRNGYLSKKRFVLKEAL